jgi:hypothetical protein
VCVGFREHGSVIVECNVRNFTSVGTAGFGVAVLASNTDLFANSLAHLAKIHKGRRDDDLYDTFIATRMISVS